ncbi:alginate export family protein [Hymenobacter daeguensis]
MFWQCHRPIGPSNLLDLHPGVELHLRPRMTLLVDVAWLWRESTRDAIYGPAMLPLLPAADVPGPAGPPLSTRRYIGRQLTADWAWQASRHVVLEFTYAWLPVGDHVRDTTPGRTLSYFKPTLLFQF